MTPKPFMARSLHSELIALSLEPKLVRMAKEAYSAINLRQAPIAIDQLKILPTALIIQLVVMRLATTII